MIFQFIDESVRRATDAFVTPAALNLMFALQMLVLTGVTLYITMTGYAIATGAVESPFWTFLKQCLKTMVIAFFALTADGYIDGVMSAINELEIGLSQAMNVSGSMPMSIYQILDQSMNHSFDLVRICFQRADEAGWNLGSALGWDIVGIIITVSTVFITVLGGAVVIVSEFALAVMLALGPLFIVCLMFPVTAKFFDGWFSQVMNYILTMVIMVIVMSFAMRLYDSLILNVDFSGNGYINPMFAALQIGTLSGVLCWIIMQASGMASGLAGGVSMAAMSMSHIISPFTNSYRYGKSARDTINPISTRQDLKSGMTTTARFGSHFRNGNTKWNPAYKQHIKQNIGNKNWGRSKGGSVKE